MPVQPALGALMETHCKIVAAIESYNSWERPWEFFPSVLSSLELDARKEMEHVWATAGEAAIWSTCKDLAHGCSLADAHLSENYPWLSVKARQQLVNGVAYQWQ
jgi:hypothetical protein